jgi:hypothetical protein
MADDEPDFYCPTCGRPTHEDTTFCQGCGTDVRQIPAALRGGMTSWQRDVTYGLITLGIGVVNTAVGVTTMALPILLIASPSVAYGLFRVGRGVYRARRDATAAPRALPLAAQTVRQIPALKRAPTTRDLDDEPTQKF